MEHICNRCGQPIERGTKVVQMLRGKLYFGYITPAWSGVLAEWHMGCFHEFELCAQTPPYRCQLCVGRIAHGDPAFCFVIGSETTADHSISERRGYEIYSVRHIDCQIEMDRPC